MEMAAHIEGEEKLAEAIGSLRKALMDEGKDCANLLRDEHRRLARQIVNFTPPFGKGGARQVGELAVKKDLYSLISEANYDFLDKVSSEHGIQNVDALVPGARGTLKHLMWDHVVTNEAMLEMYHQQYRNARGRVPRGRNFNPQVWSSRIVVPKGMRDPYVAKIQARVGIWKAKWAKGAVDLGDKFPSWITRHFAYIGKDSFLSFDFTNPDAQFVMFGGRGPDFRRDVQKITAALKSRTSAIARRVKLIVSGYSKDLSQKMKARSHAKETDNEPYEDVD